jgi:hypothetical protein
MEHQRMIEEIRELFQSLIAPQLEGIRGDIRALDARVAALDTKMESFRRELLSEIRRVDEVLSADFVRMEEKVDLRLANVDTRLTAMNEKIDLYRRELR